MSVVRVKMKGYGLRRDDPEKLKRYRMLWPDLPSVEEKAEAWSIGDKEIICEVDDLPDWLADPELYDADYISIAPIKKLKFYNQEPTPNLNKLKNGDHAEIREFVKTVNQIVMTEPDGNVHVVPLDREHIESKDCWCEPELIQDIDDIHGVQVWLHREIH